MTQREPNLPSVSVIPNLPLSLGIGGFEIQLLNSISALRDAGVQVQEVGLWDNAIEGDVIHVYGSGFNQLELMMRLPRLGKPIVVSSMLVRTASALTYDVWSRVDKLLPLSTTFGMQVSVLKRADAVVCISESQAEDVVRWGKVRESKIHVIPNGVDASYFSPSPALAIETVGLHDYVLCVGSVEPLKQQHVLIEACKLANKPLVIVGKPSVIDARSNREYCILIEKLVEESPNVKWIKGVDRDDPLLPSLYAAAKIHALPTKAEVQGMVSLEAAAAGKPIVMSDLPNLKRIFGKHAFYFNSGSSKDLASTILTAWDAAPNYSGVSWLLSWKDVAEKLIKVYQTVL